MGEFRLVCIGSCGRRLSLQEKIFFATWAGFCILGDFVRKTPSFIFRRITDLLQIDRDWLVLIVTHIEVKVKCDVKIP